MMSVFLRTSSRAAAAVPKAARTFSSTPTRPVARITIIGNLAGPPELKATSTGHEILRYAVASNHGPADNRQTSWFNVASFEAEGPRRDYLLSLPKGWALFLSHVTHCAVINTLPSGPERWYTSRETLP